MRKFLIKKNHIFCGRNNSDLKVISFDKNTLIFVNLEAEMFQLIGLETVER